MKAMCRRCNSETTTEITAATGLCPECLSASAAGTVFPDETLVRMLLRGMTPAQRKLVFEEFCAHCGSDDPRCRCWDDE